MKKHYKISILFCLLILNSAIHSQTIWEYDNDFYGKISKYAYQSIPTDSNLAVKELFFPAAKSFHTAIKPYSFATDNHIDSKIFKNFKFGKNDTHKKVLTVSPIMNLLPVISSKAKLDEININVGTKLSYYIKKRREFLIQAYIVTGSYTLPEMISSPRTSWKSPDTMEVIPRLGYSSAKNNDVYNYVMSEFLISFSPSKYINLQAGKGRHFWGDGYRSLFLSDNSNSFPYYKTTLNIWHIKYTHMIAALSDPAFTTGETIANSENRDIIINKNGKESFERKYASMHYLSYNIGKRINIGFFETIVWNARDTVGKRGIELNYFNPAVMLRPAEFAYGSPDNAIMGVSCKLNLPFNVHIYGQALIDELVISELRAGDNWWGNKYGLQGGIKLFDLLGINNLSALAEYNTVRPFTYSHENPLQNYGHLLQPLAHPLGANFNEMIGLIRYSRNRWEAGAKIMIAKYGVDNETSNIGHDIYKSYFTRQSFVAAESDYGHIQNQGLARKQVYATLQVAYTLPKTNRIKVEAGYRYRNLTDTNSNTYNYFYIGMKTDFAHKTVDYIDF